jgi:hypothetical protein
MKKNTKCAVIDKQASELHDLYEKHEFKAISEGNAIEFCPGCGSWHAHLDRDNMVRDEGKMVPLLPRDFGKTGPFSLKKVMARLSAEQRYSLAKYLRGLGYGSKDTVRRQEILKYINEGEQI